ncbi:MAG TPA: hypothetical protein VEK34_14060 [Methylocella sp.]|nr:hypothetical protein [Methylocella sp.]
MVESDKPTETPPPLTAEQKLLIQQYMLESKLPPEAEKLIERKVINMVIPSATWLTIVSILVGFGIDHFAKDTALTDYIMKYNGFTQEATVKIAAARAGAENAQKSAEAAADQLSSMKQEASTLVKELKEAKIGVDNILGGEYRKFASELLEKDEFKKSVLDAASAKISDFVSKVQKHDEKLTSLSAWHILGIARVKERRLIYASDGVSYDNSTGMVSFPNPTKLNFVPIVSDSQDYSYITDTHWIRQILPPNQFIVVAHALDTGGTEKNAPAHDFTAVVVGFESSAPGTP